jgi:hypothetical protein
MKSKMTPTEICADHNQRATNTPLPKTAAKPNRGESGFVPAPDEVARRAYFTYVNQGSRPGHDVQHWLEAESQLLAERNRTRVHGYHNAS